MESEEVENVWVTERVSRNHRARADLGVGDLATLISFALNRTPEFPNSPSARARSSLRTSEPMVAPTRR